MNEAPYHHEPDRAAASCAAYWIHTQDDVRLRVAAWKAPTAEQGTILVFPGRTEYAEKYHHTVTRLISAGFSCLVIDWRGQGLSDRLTKDSMVSHVNRFSDYQMDVAAMIAAAKRLDLPRPWYLLAHSMGGTIGLRALEKGLPVKACAFTAPMWGIEMSPLERIAAWPLMGAARALGLSQVYAPGNAPQKGQCYVHSVRFEDNRLTQDRDRFQALVREAYSLPNHQTGAPSAGWVFEAMNECRRLSRLPSPDCPAYTISGTEDVVVDNMAIQTRMADWLNGQRRVVEGAKHDLLSERDDLCGDIVGEFMTFFSQNR